MLGRLDTWEGSCAGILVTLVRAAALVEGMQQQDHDEWREARHRQAERVRAAAPDASAVDLTADNPFTITVKDLAFSPDCFKAASTSSITIVNNDSVDHTFTIDGTQVDAPLPAGQTFNGESADSPPDAPVPLQDPPADDRHRDRRLRSAPECATGRVGRPFAPGRGGSGPSGRAATL